MVRGCDNDPATIGHAASIMYNIIHKIGVAT
jgi:hypothetical protein